MVDENIFDSILIHSFFYYTFTNSNTGCCTYQIAFCFRLKSKIIYISVKLIELNKLTESECQISKRRVSRFNGMRNSWISFFSTSKATGCLTIAVRFICQFKSIICSSIRWTKSSLSQSIQKYLATDSISKRGSINIKIQN